MNYFSSLTKTYNKAIDFKFIKYFLVQQNCYFSEKDQRLALIDFGLCAEVPLPDTRNMTLAIVHLMQGDVPGLLEDAIELGFLPQDVNKETLLPGM